MTKTTAADYKPLEESQTTKNEAAEEESKTTAATEETKDESIKESTPESVPTDA